VLPKDRLLDPEECGKLTRPVRLIRRSPETH
jgi:hypothetical protein